MFLSGVHSLLNQRKKQKHGFPIKDFGNDGGGVIPECFYEESKLLKGKNLDSHLLVTPAIFKPGSTVFKSIWIPA